MGNIIVVMAPFIIGLNGVLLIVLEIMDSAKKKRKCEEMEEEKERAEIRAQWENLP